MGFCNCFGFGGIECGLTYYFVKQRPFFLCHGESDAFWFSLKHRFGLAESSLSLISPRAFSKNAVMISGACFTGKDIAQRVSKRLGIKVFAPMKAANYSGGSDTGVLLRDEVVYDNGDMTIHPAGTSRFSQDKPDNVFFRRKESGKEAISE